jgi:phage portal protein BeeE
VRLVDALMGRERAFNPDNASGASVLMQSFGTPDNERILPTFLNAAQANASSGVVFGVILARLSLFTEAELKFQRFSDKSLFGNSDLAKLETPWPNGTTGELLARMEQDASLAGNAYIRDAGSQLERLRPDWTTIVSELVRDEETDTQIRRVIGYFYEPAAFEQREPEFYPVDEVAHWSPIPDPLATFRGMSWLTPVLREVDADTQMTEYKRAYLNNAATPNLLIKYPAKLDPGKVDRLRTRLEARHSGVANSFRTMILDEGADPMLVGNTFEQMSFAAVQAAGENRIAVAAGVPGIVAGLKEGLSAATYSNYEQAMRRFADLTMRPNWRSAVGVLAKLVNVPADARLWYDASGIAALRQGEKEQADTMFVIAQAAEAFIRAGYTAESITAALSAADVTLLKHSGLVSVQMQTPGSNPKEGA